MRGLRIVSAILSIVTVVVTGNASAGTQESSADVSEGFANVTGGFLGQNWSSEIREQFWYTSQGSETLPYSWFLALEQADSIDLFRSESNIDRIGYIPSLSGLLNPDGLPIGFAKNVNKESGKEWMGFSCAACHTNQIRYKGQKFVVDGAPALANFTKFFRELNQALKKTMEDKANFKRFANKVLTPDHTQKQIDKLKVDLAEMTSYLEDREQLNSVSHSPGYARVDAFGYIFNQVSHTDLDVTENGAPADAPVSYPFLWGSHQSDVVQWNGSAPNSLILGRLSRNIGEVTGVYGKLQIDPVPWWKFWRPNKGYKSTIDLTNLGKLEFWVKNLRSPIWPSDYFENIEIKRDLADSGKALYSSSCSSCHQIVERSEQAQSYNAVMTPVGEVGTDPKMVDNFNNRMSKTGKLEGTRQGIVFNEKFGETSQTVDIVINGVIGVILRNPIKAIKAGIFSDLNEGNKLAKTPVNERLKRLDSYLANDEDRAKEMVFKALETRMGQSMEAAANRAYKARPLNGIWATAPYLHNGSVPNLRELLKRDTDRIKEFYVGSQEFDPINVGFEYGKESGGSKFDASLIGNLNTGHNYGTDLSDQEKLALIEYMKTL